MCQKYYNDEQGAREGREIQPRKESDTGTAGTDTFCATVVDSVTVLVHKSLPDIDPSDRLEDRLSLDHKSTKFVCLRL